MKTYPYIAYFGKSEVIVNEHLKPSEPIYDYAPQKREYKKSLEAWNKSCKTVPIAQGHEEKIEDYCYKMWHELKGSDRIKYESFPEHLQNYGIHIPSELARFEHHCSANPKNNCAKDGCKGMPDCGGEIIETAFFVEKEQETNEAIEFAEYLYMNYKLNPHKEENLYKPKEWFTGDNFPMHEGFTIQEVYKSFLTRMLEYKTNVVAVNPKHTSQTCNECGSKDSRSRISQSEFVCTNCGHISNADVNAAKNILGKGIAVNRKNLN